MGDQLSAVCGVGVWRVARSRLSALCNVQEEELCIERAGSFGKSVVCHAEGGSKAVPEGEARRASRVGRAPPWPEWRGEDFEERRRRRS